MPILIGPGDITVNAWNNLRKNFGLYANFVFWFGALAALQWAFAVISRTMIADKLLRAVTYGLLSLPIYAVYAALTAAVMSATAKLLRNKSADAREATADGFHHLISFIWTSALLTAVIGLGFVLLVLPGVLFFIWYKFAPYHTVVDEIKGTAALRQSKKLVQGRWWSVWLRVVIPALFFYVAATFTRAVAYLLIGSVLGDPSMFFGSVAGNGAPLSFTLVTALVPALVSGFTLPLFVAADLILWFDLKRTA